MNLPQDRTRKRLRCGRPALAVFQAAAVVIALMSCLVSEATAQIVSAKRGFADTGASQSHIHALNAGWYYRWGPDKPDIGNLDAQFVPQIWGGFQANQSTIDMIKGYGDIEWVLGFNEPERTDQNNFQTPADAIARWQVLSDGFAGSGIKLASPGVSDTGEGQQWLSQFMQMANAQGLQVDAVAFHWYGVADGNNPAGAASSFLSRVDSYHNQYGLPVWITEFAIHDWNNNETDEQIRAANAAFLDIVVPALESRNYVVGYAWYNWFGDATLVEGIPLTPTNVGIPYVGTLGTGDVYDFAGEDLGEHIAYLNGGELTHGGGSAGTVRYLNALGGTSTISGTADWGLAPTNWARVQPGATLRKNGSNTVTWDGIRITNNGVIDIADGVLRLTGNTLSGGLGTIRVSPGGTLDVSGLSSPFRVSFGQTLHNDSNTTVVGDVIAVSGATVSGGGTFADNLTAQAGATVRVGRQSESTIYSESFSGSGGSLNGRSEETQSATWSSSATFGDDGNLAENIEGGALLPFTPEVNTIYELSLDVFNTTDRWIGLGFARDPISVPGGESISDRFSNELEGVSWMLYRDHGNQAQEIEVYGGLRTGGAISDNNVAINFNQTNTLKIVVDTSGDGSSFTTDFLLDQGSGFVSLSRGPQAINLSIDNLNYVGASFDAFDDATTSNVMIDNFLLKQFSLSGAETLTVLGDYAQEADSILELEIYGPSSHDVLDVGGNLSAGGTLEVQLTDDAPALAAGGMFDVLDFASMSEAFSSLNLPSLPAGLTWDTSNLYTDGLLAVVAGLAGDYNGDSTVDAADYTVWRDNLGGDPSALALGSRNPENFGAVSMDDYNFWVDNFGTSLGSAAASSSPAVPEPATWLLAVSVLMSHVRLRNPRVCRSV